jgi:hypothetical protein
MPVRTLAVVLGIAGALLKVSRVWDLIQHNRQARQAARVVE